MEDYVNRMKFIEKGNCCPHFAGTFTTLALRFRLIRFHDTRFRLNKFHDKENCVEDNNMQSSLEKL